MRFPVTAKIALATAGPVGGTAGSPTPLGGPGLPGAPGGFLDGDHVSLPGYGAVFAFLE